MIPMQALTYLCLLLFSILLQTTGAICKVLCPWVLFHDTTVIDSKFCSFFGPFFCINPSPSTQFSLIASTEFFFFAVAVAPMLSSLLFVCSPPQCWGVQQAVVVQKTVEKVEMNNKSQTILSWYMRWKEPHSPSRICCLGEGCILWYIHFSIFNCSNVHKRDCFIAAFLDYVVYKQVRHIGSFWF